MVTNIRDGNSDFFCVPRCGLARLLSNCLSCGAYPPLWLFRFRGELISNVWDIVHVWDIRSLIEWDTWLLMAQSICIFVEWVCESIKSCIFKILMHWKAVLRGVGVVAGSVVAAGIFQRMYESWLDRREMRSWNNVDESM